MGRLLPLVLLLPACAFDPGGVTNDGSGAGDDASGGDAAAPDDDAPPPPIDASPIDAEPACPVGYVAADDLNAYRFDESNVGWTAARDDCADDLPGFTHLVIIGSDAENAHADAVSAMRGVWIGATDVDDEGEWVDVLGAPQTYRNWGFLEPNNGGLFGPEEDCVELRDGGTWNDLQCGDDRRYLCECDLTP